jgi:hypothetical protein
LIIWSLQAVELAAVRAAAVAVIQQRQAAVLVVI